MEQQRPLPLVLEGDPPPTRDDAFHQRFFERLERP